MTFLYKAVKLISAVGFPNAKPECLDKNICASAGLMKAPSTLPTETSIRESDSLPLAVRVMTTFEETVVGVQPVMIMPTKIHSLMFGLCATRIAEAKPKAIEGVIKNEMPRNSIRRCFFVEVTMIKRKIHTLSYQMCLPMTSFLNKFCSRNIHS